MSTMSILPALGRAIVVTLSVATMAPATMARRHDVADAAYLARGAKAEFAAVGAIRRGDSHNGSVFLIAPDWVLTDAHVLSDRVEGATVVRPMTSMSIHFHGEQYGIRDIVVHDGYWAKAHAADPEVFVRRGIDVALVRLDRPVTGIDPLPLTDRDPPAGTLLTFVGLGTSGTSQSAVTAPVSDGLRRAGTNVLDQVGGRLGTRRIPEYLLVGDFDHPTDPGFNKTGSASATELEAQPVGGDSGGPIMASIAGRWTAVGVFVTGTIALNDQAADGIYGSVWYGTSIAHLRPWIREVLEARS